MRQLTRTDKAVFVLSALGLCIYAGTKHPSDTGGDGIGGDGGSTNAPPALMAMRPRLAAPPPSILVPDENLVCPPEIRHPRQFELIQIRYEPGHSFDPPAGASASAGWFAHGAYEAWSRSGLHGVAFTGGYLRPTARDDAAELGYHADDYRLAVRGESLLWWNDSTVTWRDFRTRADTNASLSVQIEFGNPFIVRTNAVAYVFSRAYTPTNDATLTVSLSVPRVVYKDGSIQSVTYGCTSLASNFHARMTLDIEGGADRVRLWADESRTTRLELPIEREIRGDASGGFFVEYAATSGQADDIRFTLKAEELEASEPGGECAKRIRSATMTAAEIVRLDLESSAAGVSTNPPPFEVGSAGEFNVSASPFPDRHLVIPFENVWDPTNGFREYHVDASLVVLPSDFTANAVWTRDADTPRSGSFITGDLAATFWNPQVGGVYRVTAALDGIATTGVFVLPLAGAEMSDVLRGDLVRADRVCAWVDPLILGASEQARAISAYGLFGFDVNGFYRGRPDAVSSPTVWCYNQVRDSDGKGAVGTLFGLPVRIEKLSNLVVGYAAVRLHASALEMWLAQFIGTPNDASATASWNAGVAVAGGADFDTIVSNFVWRTWSVSDAKNRRLWPNAAFVDNHVPDGDFDFNTQFHSPGFLSLTFERNEQ